MDKDSFIKLRNFFEIPVNKEEILDLKNLFGNDNPVRLEIGCGRGEFIAQKSRLHQDKNFLGLEVKETRVRSTISKLDIEKNGNVRMMRVFVDKEMKSWFPVGELERIYIIHPDPWPKRKHHRRRLIQPKFIDVLANLLKPGGLLEMATDHHEYAMWIIRHFKEREDFEVVYPEGYQMIPDEDHIETYFEKLKRSEGFEPHFMLFKRR